VSGFDCRFYSSVTFTSSCIVECLSASCLQWDYVLFSSVEIALAEVYYPVPTNHGCIRLTLAAVKNITLGLFVMPFISWRTQCFGINYTLHVQRSKNKPGRWLWQTQLSCWVSVSKTCHDPVRLNFSLRARCVQVGIVCGSFWHHMKSWGWNRLECLVLGLLLFQVVLSHSGLYVGCSAVWFSSLCCFHAYHIHYELEFVHFFGMYRASSLATGGMSSFLRCLFQNFCVCVCLI
jgi:hypothetical protein